MRPVIGLNAPCSVGNFAWHCSNLAFERVFVIAAAIYYQEPHCWTCRTLNWRPGTLHIFCFIQKILAIAAWYNLTQEIQFLKFMGGSNYFRFITVFQCQYIPMCGSMMHVLQYTTRHGIYSHLHTSATLCVWPNLFLLLIHAWLLAVCVHKYKNS